MDRQCCRRPGRPRPFPPPGPPITSPSERRRRRAHGRDRPRAPCARAKPPCGRCTDVLSTTNLGVRYTYKAGTLHELTSRKAAIFPLPQPLQTLTSALRRAHAAPAAPRHFGPVSAAAAQRHGAPVATGAQRQPRQRPLVRPRGLEHPLLARELARRDAGAVPPIQPAHRRRDLAWRPAIPPRRLAHLRLDLAPGRERRSPGRAVQRRARPRPRAHVDRRVVEPGADPRYRLTSQLADQSLPQQRRQFRCGRCCASCRCAGENRGLTGHRPVRTCRVVLLDQYYLSVLVFDRRMLVKILVFDRSSPVWSLGV